ncbi:MAG: ribosome-associated translation inhibitor RaiA [Polyangiaceae bacterium]
MNISTTFRQMHGTDAVRDYAEGKIGKLQKFLRQNMRAEITLSVEGNDHIAEVQVSSGPTRLRGSERSEDMYASIDLVVDKLERQLRSVKGLSLQRKRHGMKAGEFAAQSTRNPD